MKIEKERAEKMFEERITQCNDELTAKKFSVIADLESKKEFLLSKVCQNPWLWDCESFQIKVDSQCRL